jgi:hypothetical protein
MIANVNMASCCGGFENWLGIQWGDEFEVRNVERRFAPAESGHVHGMLESTPSHGVSVSIYSQASNRDLPYHLHPATTTGLFLELLFNRPTGAGTH